MTSLAKIVSWDSGEIGGQLIYVTIDYDQIFENHSRKLLRKYHEKWIRAHLSSCPAVLNRKNDHHEVWYFGSYFDQSRFISKWL